MIQIKDYKNLYRDEQSGAIVNNDTNEYLQYVKMREDKKRDKEEINNLKKEIAEIKSLLKELLNES